jgi:hypothetical protein
MAATELFVQLDRAKRDLDSVTNTEIFRQQIRGNSVLMEPWSQARALADYWLSKVEGLLPRIDDLTVRPLILFLQTLSQIIDGHVLRPNESIPDAIRKATAEFRVSLPLLIYGILEARGITKLSDQDIPTEVEAALKKVAASAEAGEKAILKSLEDAKQGLKNNVEEAVAAVESARDKASEISVDSAQQQFRDAAKSFRNNAIYWGLLSGAFFGVLIFYLTRLNSHPPELIQIVVNSMKSNIPLQLTSIPLLITTSAYYTSIRLAFIGVLGIGLAFSLRMTRAYLHMIEYNRHKLRVTNSIEAFIAAVRTNTQKDLVLSKLVESVTDFGDPGILDKSKSDGSGLPSVFLEAVTKNITKAD